MDFGYVPARISLTGKNLRNEWRGRVGTSTCGFGFDRVERKPSITMSAIKRCQRQYLLVDRQIEIQGVYMLCRHRDGGGCFLLSQPIQALSILEISFYATLKSSISILIYALAQVLYYLMYFMHEIQQCLYVSCGCNQLNRVRFDGRPARGEMIPSCLSDCMNESVTRS